MSYLPSTNTPPANWHLAHPDAGISTEVRIFDPNRDGSVHLGPFRGITYMLYGKDRRRCDRGAFWEEADAFAWARNQLESLLANGWHVCGMSHRSKSITDNDFDFNRVYGRSDRPRVAPWESAAEAGHAWMDTERHHVLLPMENGGRLRDVLTILSPTARLLINGEPAAAVDIEADQLGNQARSHFVNLSTGDEHDVPMPYRRLCRRDVVTSGGLQRLTKGVSRGAPMFANGQQVTGVRVEVNPELCKDAADVERVLSDSRFINFLTSSRT